MHFAKNVATERDIKAKVLCTALHIYFPYLITASESPEEQLSLSLML